MNDAIAIPLPLAITIVVCNAALLLYCIINFRDGAQHRQTVRRDDLNQFVRGWMARDDWGKRQPNGSTGCVLREVGYEDGADRTSDGADQGLGSSDGTDEQKPDKTARDDARI